MLMKDPLDSLKLITRSRMESYGIERRYTMLLEDIERLLNLYAKFGSHPSHHHESVAKITFDMGNIIHDLQRAIDTLAILRESIEEQPRKPT